MIESIIYTDYTKKYRYLIIWMLRQKK